MLKLLQYYHQKLSVPHNYFNDPTKSFSDLYHAKFLDTSTKLFFPCICVFVRLYSSVCICLYAVSVSVRFAIHQLRSQRKKARDRNGRISAVLMGKISLPAILSGDTKELKKKKWE